MRHRASRQLVRLAAGLTRRERHRQAERLLRWATKLHPGAPTGWYRLGRVRSQLKDWAGAEAAYAVAVGLRPSEGRWHGRRAQAAERLGQWATAVTGYTQALAQEPEDPVWVSGMARAHLAEARPAAAASLCRPLAGATGDRRVLSALATACEELGQWHAAVSVLRQLVARDPEDRPLRLRLVKMLTQQLLVPFELDDSGQPTPLPEDPGAAYDEAVSHLERLASAGDGQPHDLYQLGWLHERQRNPGAAAAAYGAALARLPAVDKWWVHRNQHEWRFRLAGVSPEQPEPRQRVVPATGAPPAVPAGFFETFFTNQGLRIAGFLTPRAGSTVEFLLDGQPLRELAASADHWCPVFLFELTQEVLAEFPRQSVLTVTAGGAPLVTVGGAAAAMVEIPDGSGKLGTLRAEGRQLTKKGSWALTGAELARRQEQYLHAYQEARAAMDQLGRQLFLCYGTLLGHCRNQDFIPGDDDFDVAYVSTAPDPVAFRQECVTLASELIGLGLDIKLSINGRPLKIGRSGVWIDATPVWLYRDRAWSFAAHDLGKAAFLPVERAEFRGQEVYVPADPEAFLADAYGEHWRTPRSDFRHYRSQADNRVLATMWLTPSDVDRIAKAAETQRLRNPAAGRFVGVDGSPVR